MHTAVPPGSVAAATPPFAFSGKIQPTRLSVAYRSGLVVVGIVMLLLPVLYVGLVALTGTAVWWHVTGNTWILEGDRIQWRLLMYVGPAIAGAMLVFFLVKPILARPSTTPELVPIDPDSEPTLFAFIAAICQQVNAPMPRRVLVDCQVNASAGFMPGYLSMVRNDLVLTIGLPLVAGLSIRELGGVLAHEFGHFAQGAGMRLTGVVRGVNAWFARVVYERDQWDEKLDKWSKAADSRISLIFVMSAVAVWLSRQILTALMMAGHAVSCFLLRQMEYDADSYEIKLAGTDAFTCTVTRLRELAAGADLGEGDLREGFRSGKMPADLPAFIVARSQQLPTEWVGRIQSSEEEKTGLFDTHPSDADRIRAARALAARGVLLGGDGAASQLIRNFDTLSAAATRCHYKHDMGLSLESLAFVDTGIAIRERRMREENQTALESFFGNRLSIYRPIHLSLGDLTALSAAELWTAVGKAREAMESTDKQLVEQYREFDALEAERDKAFVAQELLCAGFSATDVRGFELSKFPIAETFSADARLLEEEERLVPALRAFEAAAARRLACDMLLLNFASIKGSEPRGVAEAETHVTAPDPQSMVVALNALAGVMPHVRELRRLQFAMALAVRSAREMVESEQVSAHIHQLERRVISRCDLIRNNLSGVACPSGFTGAAMSLAERCGLPAVGACERPGEIVARVRNLYSSILGRLARIALEMEASNEVGAAGPARTTGL